MNYEQALPPNINALPRYSLPSHLFIYTIMVLLAFLFLTFSLILTWIYRVYKRIYNPDYLIDYIINYELAKTRRNLSVKAISPS